ncbi:MAG: SAM-dependent DNA methyltransferase [Coleofasciculaceae cyanobacterium SM2_1_6]|nr:SAM-dependent DNA methyltransferase [Coleofasciculaceae cyanobacterium SM2_1_6]
MNQLNDTDFGQKIRELIDGLKGICASYGLGNDGNEFKIITQVFLYKLMNDKFAFEVKQIAPEVIAKAETWEQALRGMSEADYAFMLQQLPANTANLQTDHFIATLYKKQNDNNFAKLFDDTLRDIVIQNNDIFSVQDISQKSSSLLRLNLILNNLVHSIPNVIQGNTLEHPYHKQGAQLAKFDYIVSNPPFKMDFSDYRENLDTKENH